MKALPIKLETSLFFWATFPFHYLFLILKIYQIYVAGAILEEYRPLE